MTTVQQQESDRSSSVPSRRRPREPLTTERIVSAARQLLVDGGPTAVVLRELARGLGVTAPALYKHVRCRDDLLTLLITTFYDELTGTLLATLEELPPADHRARLRAVSMAFRQWSVNHKAEFNLIFGAPIPDYHAPDEGPTTPSAQRFGRVFFDLSMAALDDGQLRTRPNESLPPSAHTQLANYALRLGLDLEPGQLYPVVLAWQRLLGSVAVECAGQMAWIVDDPSPLTNEAIERTLDDLLHRKPADQPLEQSPGGPPPASG